MASEATVGRVRGVVAEIFNVPLNEVTTDSSSETIENWDSMGHLTLVLQLEQEFEREFSPEQVEKMHRVGDIAAILDA